jgi:hypothetical protein
LGDILDCYWASRFHKRYGLIERAFEKEIVAWDGIRNRFDAKTTNILLGNHEARILEFLERPENAALKGFIDIHKVLAPDEDQIIPKQNCVWLAKRRLFVGHGNIVRKWSGQSAKEEMGKYGCSGVTGHSHRLSSYYERSYSGVRVWVEAGHLSKNPPRYGRINDPGPSNWQQGVVIVYVDGGTFHVEPIPFTLNYKATFHGKKYKA